MPRATESRRRHHHAANAAPAIPASNPYFRVICFSPGWWLVVGGWWFMPPTRFIQYRCHPGAWLPHPAGARAAGARRGAARLAARTRSARSGCADRRSPSAAPLRAPPRRCGEERTYGLPRSTGLLMDRAGVDDRLRPALAAEHDEQVAHHRRFPLLIER